MSESQAEEITENNQETEESETESISASSEVPMPKKVSFKLVGLLYKGAWGKEHVVWVVQWRVDCAIVNSLTFEQ